MECRRDCGACCIAPSISSPIPGMPHGKPSGVRCVNLDDDNQCTLFGLPQRPQFCVALQAAQEMCANNQQEALIYLYELDELTGGSGE